MLNTNVKNELMRLLGHLEYQYCESRSIIRENVVDYLMQNGVTIHQWIPVTEKLPEDDLPNDNKKRTIKVLVKIKAKNGITIRTQTRFMDHIYVDGKNRPRWSWRYSAGDVTHWMALPE